MNPEHWLQVDLGELHIIDGAGITWKDAGQLIKFKVDVSTDNTTWTTVVDRTQDTLKQQVYKESFSAIEARYVRVSINYYAGSGWWPAIKELEVWGEEETRDPANLVSYEAVHVTTLAGIAPKLPSSIMGQYKDGSSGQVGVIWDAIAADKFAGTGSFQVSGVVEGASVQPQATIEVEGYRDDFVRGVDISTLTAIEDLGGIYYDSNGAQRDLLDILKDRGVNYVRLRLWNDPQNSNGYNDKADVLRLAKRVKEKGMKLLLDFHYSDDWAHPGQQVPPVAWKGFTVDQLADAVYEYTHEVVSELKSAGAMPDMVQIGNEINSGVLTGNGGKVVFADQIKLLNSGARAVRELEDGNKVKIMIHLAEGGKNATFRYFFDGINQAVDYDVIGLSYYPFWHGTLEAVSSNMNDLATRYSKEVIIAETSYPFSYKEGDSHENIINNPSKLTGGATWPATVQGQYDAIKKIMDLIAQVPDDKGAGFFYWEPAWIPSGVGWIASEGDAWENQAMFDYDEYPENGGHSYAGYALDSLDVYKVGMTEAPIQRMELAKVIQDTKLLQESDYTTASWQTLAPAILQAELVYDSLTTTQMEADDASAQLQQVVSELEVLVADKTELAEWIQRAEAFHEEDWSAKTWEQLQQVLTKALNIFNDTNATQSSVRNIVTQLSAVIQNLSNADKTALNALIIQLQKLDAADYSSRSWQVLQSALADAIVVNQDVTVTQDKINTALNSLQLTKDQLIPMLDLSFGKLTTASSNAGDGGGKQNAPEGAIDDDGNTSWGTDQGPGSWWEIDLGAPSLIKKIAMKLWSGGIKYTIEISQDQEHYTTITDTTNDVITSEAPSHTLPAKTVARYIKVTITDGGEWVGISEFAALGVEVADRSSLEEIISQASLLVEEDYTATSWQALQSTLSSAHLMKDDMETTQGEMDSVVSALQLALDQLVPVSNPEKQAISLNKTTGQLRVGESMELIATVYPLRELDNKVIFTSNHSDIASVTEAVYDEETGRSSVYITALGKGQAVITATLEDGSSTAVFALTVTDEGTTIEPGISLNVTSDQLKVGQSTLLVATVILPEAADHQVRFESSNPEVATVSSAVYDVATGTTSVHVTAKNKGTALIIASTADGRYTAVYQLTVINNPTVTEPNPTPNTGSSSNISSDSNTAIYPYERVDHAKLIVDGISQQEIKISKNALKQAAASATDGLVTIVVNTKAGSDNPIITLPIGTLSELQGLNIKQLKIEWNQVKLILQINADAFETSNAKDAIQLSSPVSNIEQLTTRFPSKMTNPSIIMVSIVASGKQLSWKQGDVTVEIVYEVTSELQASQVVAYGLDDEQHWIPIISARYNNQLQTMIFTVDHNGSFAVSSTQVAFTDVPASHYAYQAITFLTANEILQGLGKGNFRPDQQVTRAEAIHMLIQALGLREDSAVSQFSDVKPDAWYTQSIVSAEKLQLIQGKAKGIFGIQDVMTRQDMTVLLYRALQSKGLSANAGETTMVWKDQDLIAEYAKSAIDRLYREGIIQGLEDGSFSPTTVTTRAQAAVMISNLLSLWYESK